MMFNKKAKVVILSCFLSLTLGLFSTTSLAKIQNEVRDVSTLTTVVSVDNFDNFTQLIDNDEITSYLDNESLYFYRYGSPVGNNISEVYVLSLDQLGNCTNFAIKMVMNYTCFEPDDSISAGAIN